MPSAGKDIAMIRLVMYVRSRSVRAMDLGTGRVLSSGGVLQALVECYRLWWCATGSGGVLQALVE